jgi:hypothetical protein
MWDHTGSHMDNWVLNVIDETYRGKPAVEGAELGRSHSALFPARRPGPLRDQDLALGTAHQNAEKRPRTEVKGLPYVYPRPDSNRRYCRERAAC